MTSLIVPPVLFVVLAVIAWKLAIAAWDLRPNVLPSPERVARKGWEDREALWQNTLPTLKETGIGISASLLAATVLAAGLDFSDRARRTLYPLLVASQSIPIIVIAPLFVIWFGFGLGPKVLVVIIATFFPLMVGMLEGFASSDPDADRLLRSMGATRAQRFVRLRVPSALPFFFAGLRIASSYAVVAAIFSESVGAKTGLGIYMQIKKNLNRTDLVLAAVVVTVVLSLAMFSLTFILQALAMPWERRRRRQGRA